MKEEKGKTWMDLAREIFPDATEDHLDFILWNHTAFPFADVDHIRRQLIDYKNIIDELNNKSK